MFQLGFKKGSALGGGTIVSMSSHTGAKRLSSLPKVDFLNITVLIATRNSYSSIGLKYFSFELFNKYK